MPEKGGQVSRKQLISQIKRKKEKSEVEFSEEQLERVRDMLYRRWEQQQDPRHPTLSVREVQEQEWANELSGEDVHELLQIGLERGGWYVHRASLPSKQDSQDVGDYHYTDAATSADSGDYVQFRI